MQCIQCGSYLSAMACQFGCPKCGYKDGWSIQESQLEIVDIEEIKNDSKRNESRNGQNIQRDPKDERSRAKRVRKKKLECIC